MKLNSNSRMDKADKSPRSGCTRGCTRGPPSLPRVKIKNPRDGLNKMKRVPKQSQDRRPSSPSIRKGASIRTESPRGRKVPSSLPVESYVSPPSKMGRKVPSSLPVESVLSAPSKKGRKVPSSLPVESKASKMGQKVPSSWPSDKHNGSKAVQSGSRVKESSRMIFTPSIYDALTESLPVSESDRYEEISAPKEKTKKKKKK